MSSKVCIIGLGYVGLPIAVEFSKKYVVTGFDINEKRIKELKSGKDSTKEISSKNLKSTNLNFTSNKDHIKDCNYYIVTVPTPVDSSNVPDFSALKSASMLVGSVLKKSDIVCYESTVYPGATEEICLPILEQTSNLKLNKEFGLGYSPERINPGDKIHTLTNIVKVVSGSDDKTLDKLKKLYNSIIKAGIHTSPNIKTAEAAKVIENTQRDVNIALINEISVICNKLNIDTYDVLEAAGTKWNFLKFQPGLVGGHCIGVDPYYLAHKAVTIGHNPEMILAGRRINDEMPSYICQLILSGLIKNKHNFMDLKILFLGVTFKENCPDTRNSKAITLFENLSNHNIAIDVYDPYIEKNTFTSSSETFKTVKNISRYKKYNAIILAVPHKQFLTKGFLNNIKKSLHKDGFLYDLKGMLPKKMGAIRL
jgi:UDP-N-acetyl-D-galactosamine dehydrogenase